MFNKSIHGKSKLHVLIYLIWNKLYICQTNSNIPFVTVLVKACSNCQVSNKKIISLKKKLLGFNTLSFISSPKLINMGYMIGFHRFCPVFQSNNVSQLTYSHFLGLQRLEWSSSAPVLLSILKCTQGTEIYFHIPGQLILYPSFIRGQSPML